MDEVEQQSMRRINQLGQESFGVSRPRRRYQLIAVCISATAMVSAITTRPAYAFPTNAEMRDVGGDPSGLPVDTLLHKAFGALAREMLLQRHLDTDADIPRPQRRGVQVELFAPGDIGIVLRYRW